MNNYSFDDNGCIIITESMTESQKQKAVLYNKSVIEYVPLKDESVNDDDFEDLIDDDDDDELTDDFVESSTESDIIENGDTSIINDLNDIF